MIIRDAVLSDAPVLAALHRAIFPDGPWEGEFWRRAISVGEGPILLAQGPNAPLGLCAVRLAADEAEILTIGVLAAARRGGIAHALLAALYPKLADEAVSQLFLEVSENNDAAQQLYRSEGFAEIGRRPHYYGPNEDALLLAKAISSAP